jgi:DNA invertase Pin-like site-specific DNA recombinase
MKTIQGQNIGYIRVSTTNQKTDRQLDGIQLDKIFEELKSGKNEKQRPVLQECLEFIRQGDCLHLHSIDRLARNLSDLQAIVARVIAKGASIHFHKENLTFSADSSNPMNQMLLQIMGAFAEFEREIIVERRREGVAIALENGVEFGRKPKVTPEIRAQLIEGRKRGVPVTELMQLYGIGRQTVYDALKKV